jgi:hypothetical protein
MKLYRSKKYPTKWIAYSRTTGWVVFPAEVDGWGKREPARGIDPIDIREVPLQLAADAHVTEAA